MIKSIVLKNGAYNMAANLYLPEEFDERGKYPVLLFVHPSGGIKEQVAGLYAEHMAEKGFVAIAFDATHYGESEGEPRYLENPMERIGDIFAVVDYAHTLSYIDEKRIGVTGISAGGSYAVAAAAVDHRICAVAGIGIYDIGGGFSEGFPLVEKRSVKDQIITLRTAAYVRTLMARGHEPIYNNLVPCCEEAIRLDTPITAKAIYDYYKTERGTHPNTNNKMLASSALYIMSFDLFAKLEQLLTQPLILICGDDSELRYYSEMVYEKATCDKKLVLIEGATHVDLYDVPKYVEKVSETLETFFRRKMQEDLQ